MIQTHVALCWEARVRRCEKIMIQELIKVSRFFSNGIQQQRLFLLWACNPCYIPLIPFAIQDGVASTTEELS